jgi:hypothetical protein
MPGQWRRNLHKGFSPTPLLPIACVASARFAGTGSSAANTPGITKSQRPEVARKAAAAGGARPNNGSGVTVPAAFSHPRMSLESRYQICRSPFFEY